MTLEVERLKKYLLVLNVLIIILGCIGFILGCLYVSQAKNEIHFMVVNYNITAHQIPETDVSITFTLMVGKILIAFGTAVGSLSILAVVGIWMYKKFILKFVTALSVVSIIVLTLIGIGAATTDDRTFVDEPQIGLPLDMTQINYIIKKYDCCEIICLGVNKDTCENAILYNSQRYRNIIAAISIIGALLDIAAVVLTVTIIKIPREKFRTTHHLHHKSHLSRSTT